MSKIVNIYNGYVGYSDQGGGIKYIENLIELQKKYFNTIYLLALGSGKYKTIKINGTKVIYYPISNSHNWVKFVVNLAIFLFTNKSTFSNLTFHIHRVYFAPFIKIIKTKKIIVTIHTKTFDAFEQTYPYLKFLIKIFILIENLLLNIFIDKITFAGIVSKKLYRLRHRNIKKKFIYLPPVFKFLRAKKTKFFKKEKKKIILVVGRLSIGKRPLEAIKLFHKSIEKDNFVANNFKICFAGNGELINDLKLYIHKNNLHKYVLPIKKIKSTEMPQLYKRSSAVLFLSKNEVNPFVIKESLSAGKPIFSTNVGTAKNMISKKNGVIISAVKIQNNLDKFIFFLKKKYNSTNIIKLSKKFINKDEDILNKSLKEIYR